MYTGLNGQSSDARVQGENHNQQKEGSGQSADLGAAIQLVKDLETSTNPKEDLYQSPTTHHGKESVQSEVDVHEGKEMEQLSLPAVVRNEESVAVPVSSIEALLQRANVIEQELQRAIEDKKMAALQKVVIQRVAEDFEEHQGSAPMAYIISQAKELGIRPEAVEQAYAEISRYAAWDDNRRQEALKLGLPENASSEVIVTERGLKEEVKPLIDRMEQMLKSIINNPTEYPNATRDLGKIVDFQNSYDAFGTRLSARPLATLLWYTTPLFGQSMFIMAVTGYMMDGAPVFAKALLPDLQSPISPALKALQAAAKRFGAEVSFELQEAEESSFLRVVPKWALPEYTGVRAVLRLTKQNKD